MPIIFAQSILIVPAFMIQILPIGNELWARDVVSSIQSGGTLTVFPGGTATSLDLDAGGTLIVASACSEGFGSPEFRAAQERLVSMGRVAEGGFRRTSWRH